MLAEWAPAFTVLGAVIAASLGLLGVAYSQRKHAERERENWRRERVYEVARDITNVVSSVHYQVPIPEPTAIVASLKPQFVLLYSLIPNFNEIDEHGAIDRFIDGEGDARDNIVQEVEGMMQIVVRQLHTDEERGWFKRKKTPEIQSHDPDCDHS